MQQIASGRLQIAYDGPALRTGRMPMLALGTGLRGQALLIERVSELLNGESVALEVDVDSSFESGSLVVAVHILTDEARITQQLIESHGFGGFTNLLTLLGFMGVNAPSLYKLFKRRRGRPIEAPEDIPRGVEANMSISIEMLIQVYNDQEVQTQLRKTIDPLRFPGIRIPDSRRLISQLRKRPGGET